MNQTTVERLDALFMDEPLLKGGGVGTACIDAAERDLGVVFSDDYRQFLGSYGGALVGPYPVYGLVRADPMDARLWSVVTVTKHFRAQSWPGSDRWYVISMDHAGNPIGIDASGKVHVYDHDSGELVEIATSFEQFLVSCLSKL